MLNNNSNDKTTANSDLGPTMKKRFSEILFLLLMPSIQNGPPFCVYLLEVLTDAQSILPQAGNK